MIVPPLAILVAPLTKLVVTIIGSISGVSPTATERPNSNASSQSPLVKLLIRKITVVIITVNFIKRYEVFRIPRSKLVSVGVIDAEWAIPPNKVWFPVAITTPSACPLVT